jgi:hypothetical protein
VSTHKLVMPLAQASAVSEMEWIPLDLAWDLPSDWPLDSSWAVSVSEPPSGPVSQFLLTSEEGSGSVSVLACAHKSARPLAQSLPLLEVEEEEEEEKWGQPSDLVLDSAWSGSVSVLACAHKSARPLAQSLPLLEEEWGQPSDLVLDSAWSGSVSVLACAHKSARLWAESLSLLEEGWGQPSDFVLDLAWGLPSDSVSDRRLDLASVQLKEEQCVEAHTCLCHHKGRECPLPSLSW